MHPLWPSLVSSNSQHWKHLKIGQGQTLVITAGGVDSEVCFRWEKPEQFWCLLRRARVGIATHTSREGEELGESEGRPETGQSCYWGALNTLVTMGERGQWRCRKVNVFCLVAARKNVLFATIKKRKGNKRWWCFSSWEYFKRLPLSFICEAGVCQSLQSSLAEA